MYNFSQESGSICDRFFPQKEFPFHPEIIVFYKIKLKYMWHSGFSSSALRLNGEVF